MAEGQQEPAEGRTVRPAAAWLQEQRNGGLHAELSEALAETAAAVIEHGKAGAITLKIALKPTGDGVSLSVTDDLTVKAPKAKQQPALFFADSEGNLTRQNPQQLAMDGPLRTVAGGKTEDTPIRRVS